MLVKVTDVITYEGQVVEAGETIDVPQSTADYLLKHGVAKKAAPTKKGGDQ